VKTVRDVILKKIIDWANEQKEIRMMVLVGSLGREKNVDELSDIDITLFVESYECYVEDDSWIHDIGRVWVYIPEVLVVKEKAYPTRLVIFEHGVKVDFAFYPINILDESIDDTNLYTTLNMGYKTLIDKDRNINRLPIPTAISNKPKIPSEKEFNELVNEFWFEA
jgi:aminoglycoside 6-adenylyltransferase